MGSNTHSIKIPQYNNMKWYRVVDTSANSGDFFFKHGKEKLLKNHDYYNVNSRSIVVLLSK